MRTGAASQGAIGLDFVLLAALTTLLRWPLLSASALDWDESAFILSAREVLFGHLPYTVFFDNKPVGSSVLLAAVMSMFGQFVEPVRLFGVCCVTATSWFCYLITRGFAAGRIASVSAGLLYVAFSMGLHGTATMTEIMLAPFSSAGVLLLMLAARGDQRQRLLVGLAGLLFGIAVWIKYVPVIPAAFVGLVCLADMRRRRQACVWSAAWLYAAGIVMPTLMTVAVYAMADQLPAFWYANFGFASKYIAATNHHETATRLMEAATDLWPLVFLSGLFAWPDVARTVIAHRPVPGLMVATWLLGEAIAVVLPLQFYANYFLMIVPALCVVAALAIGAAASRVTVARLRAPVALACAVAGGLPPIANHASAIARAARCPDIPRLIAAMIDPRLRPGELVYVVNYQPIIYVLTGSALPTRYAFPTHLLGSQRDLVPVDRLAELRRLLDRRPRAIVLDDAANSTDEAMVDQTARGMIERAVAASYDDAAAFDGGHLAGCSVDDVRVFMLRD